jgi:hypothetical protein
VVAVDNNDTANLNEAPVRTLNDCVAHCDGYLSSGRISRDVQKSRAQCLFEYSCGRRSRGSYQLSIMLSR